MLLNNIIAHSPELDIFLGDLKVMVFCVRLTKQGHSLVAADPVAK